MAETTNPDAVTVRMAASPAEVWAVVSDPTGYGRLSPECTGGRWLDGATGPAEGARFKGTNKRGIIRWSTTCTVDACVPNEVFSFVVNDSSTRWTYRLEADGDGTLVTESREAAGEYPALARFFTRFLLGGVEDHTEELRDGMRATLERVRAIVEA
jgi:uncharacterized protein YndB with AHSA1/START domain